ncbi:hypothetical protein AGLY_004997, partial [Aphis glycines]
VSSQPGEKDKSNKKDCELFARGRLRIVVVGVFSSGVRPCKLRRRPFRIFRASIGRHLRQHNLGIQPCKLGLRFFRICLASIDHHLRGSSGMRGRHMSWLGTRLPGMRRVQRGMVQLLLLDSGTDSCNQSMHKRTIRGQYLKEAISVSVLYNKSANFNLWSMCTLDVRRCSVMPMPGSVVPIYTQSVFTELPWGEYLSA